MCLFITFGNIVDKHSTIGLQMLTEKIQVQLILQPAVSKTARHQHYSGVELLLNDTYIIFEKSERCCFTDVLFLFFVFLVFCLYARAICG